MVDEIPVGGAYLLRAGRRFRVVLGGVDHVGVSAPHDRDLFPDALGFGGDVATCRSA